MLTRHLVLLLGAALLAFGQEPRGYYRTPALHGSTIVFTSEGDLWQVGVEGGAARRLTTHPAAETLPFFSPDGKTIAFQASYEGVPEVYTMPATGGLPTRRSFGGATPVGWTPDGRILASTRLYSTLPDAQLITIDKDNAVERIPLSQAAQGVYDTTGKTLFFTRLPFQGSQAKRYQGGTAQKIWKYAGAGEATPLTANYQGTSREAMYWRGRVYFATDRDGTMNIWSMNENGADLRQHTHHQGWDVLNAQLSDGRIVYQLGADLHIYEIAGNRDRKLDITVLSDFDHLRERWIKTPAEYMSAARLAPDGSAVALVSRGKAFVAPAKNGRLVAATERKPARYRDARLMPDGKTLLVLSTESGEVELWTLPANGIGKAEQLTTDGSVLRWDAVPSPDGKFIAHSDKDNRLWLLDVKAKTSKLVATGNNDGNSNNPFASLAWSPDSRWFSYATSAANTFDQIWIYEISSKKLTAATTDRYNSSNPAWSSDGKYLYFLSDRALHSTVFSPWGTRAPEPHFDKSEKIYQLALKKGLRSPFLPPDELHPDKPEAKTDKPAEKPAEKAAEKPAGVHVEIEFDGLAERLEEVPVPAGNYGRLQAAPKRLCWIDQNREDFSKTALQCLDIANKGDKPETLMEGVGGFEISQDGKKMMVRKQMDLYIFDSSIKEGAAKTPKTLTDSKVDLRGWTFSVIPSEEFQEAFHDAWRLHRDYFYDRHMHGVDWPLMRKKYGELLNRVRDRQELNDLIAQMVAELNVLHTFVMGGDIRPAPDQIRLAGLGARLERDEAAGGWRVAHVYKNDPDRPDKRAPLARPEVDVHEGDILVSINGRDTLAAAHPLELMRNLVGKPVLLRVKPAGKTETRDVMVKPISLDLESDLRYGEWEYTRRLEAEKLSGGKVGYVHLRAMGSGDIAQWAENYYPVFDREALIVDVRHNNGGNIDSWILSKLLRKVWMYWQPRQGATTWNMQYAFRGPVIVLCDERTASDGEAFSDGFHRLGLGKVLGTRTWGGEVWLTSSNVLADRGIASAAEIGVFGPERQWLIEGHGVDPDIVVDNLPKATYDGTDAQLEAGVKNLLEQLKAKPVTLPQPPPYPDKSFPVKKH
jgi:tricorn protease